MDLYPVENLNILEPLAIIIINYCYYYFHDDLIYKGFNYEEKPNCSLEGIYPIPNKHQAGTVTVCLNNERKGTCTIYP